MPPPARPGGVPGFALSPTRRISDAEAMAARLPDRPLADLHSPEAIRGCHDDSRHT